MQVAAAAPACCSSLYRMHAPLCADPGAPCSFSAHSYSLHDLEAGYCQGMAFAAGVLLMYVPEEPAFRCVHTRRRMWRWLRAMAGHAMLKA